MQNRVWKFLCVVLAIGLIPLFGPGEASAGRPVGALPSTSAFVVQQYADFLSREPTSEELNDWTRKLETGTQPMAMIETIARSPEFEGTVAPVVRLYRAHFLRAPDFSGLTHWAGVARGGVSVPKISEEFVLSDEFTQRYGALSDEAYVNQVYTNVLGRPADASGKAYWISELQRGVTRGEVMVAFSDSVEYRNANNSLVLATMLYVGLLGRVPEADGLRYWMGEIDRGASYQAIVDSFFRSDEYDGRIKGLYTTNHPLTGQPAKAVGNYPALAIKIDNVSAARAQVNIDRSDIVYEEMVEGNVTRFVAVFHSDIPDVVGPVRSIRTTDLDILSQLNTPLLSASGANAGVLRAVDGSRIVNLNANQASSAYFRVAGGRRAPHNMFVRPFALYQASNGRGHLPPQLLNYRGPGVRASGGQTATVSINFGKTLVEFAWSDADGGWKRFQDRSAHVVSGGRQLAPENVVVLETNYVPGPVDAKSPRGVTVGTGKAYVFTDGVMFEGIWSRDNPAAAIQLKDAQGNLILLTQGQTFIELAPPGSITIS